MLLAQTKDAKFVCHQGSNNEDTDPHISLTALLVLAIIMVENRFTSRMHASNKTVTEDKEDG